LENDAPEAIERGWAAFDPRVGKDPVDRPFLPAKSLKCAAEEFAAFLIQFLGGEEKQTRAHSAWSWSGPEATRPPNAVNSRFM